MIDFAANTSAMAVGAFAYMKVTVRILSRMPMIFPAPFMAAKAFLCSSVSTNFEST